MERAHRRCPDPADGENTLVCEHGDEQVRIPFDAALVAVGRAARTADYGLDRLGFIAATALFVPACLALLTERGLLRLTGAAIAVSIAVFVLFGLVLGVDLPKGRLLSG